MLHETSVGGWLDALAAHTATPGGGGSAALMGAMGASLVSMVCRLSLSKGAEGQRAERLSAVLERSESLRRRLTALVDADRLAYEQVMQGYALPRATPADKERRTEAIQAALRGATLVPLECARASAHVLSLVPTVAEEGQLSALGEAGVAGEAANAALRASALNVTINLGSIRDQDFVEEQRAQLEAIRSGCRQIQDHIHALLGQRLGQAPGAPQGAPPQGGHSVGHP